MFGFSAEGIRRFLKRKKVRRRTQTETSTVHTLNHQYFNTLSIKKAFWLGFIINRAHIVKRTEDSWYIMILVPENKLELLKRFRTDISCSKPIYKQKDRSRYVLSIVSTSWARHLLRLGWRDFRSGQREELTSRLRPELLEDFEKGEAASE